ncbi:MAG: MOMP family protein [Simkania sp.]|nr:MOMP family protein [Simkania sp.]
MKFKYFLFFLSPILLFGDFQKDAILSDTSPKDAIRSARTCHDLNGVYVTGDFLYWKVMQDELQYAACFIPTFTASLTTIDIQAKEIDFEYKPGFRIGLGGDLPWNGWDLYLSWTRLSFDISSSTTSDSADLFLITGDEGFSFLGRKAKIKWDFTYNSLEFDYGRRMFLDSSWIIRPSFGMKTVWFDQESHQSLFEVESFNPNGVGLAGANEYWRGEFDYWGIGPFASFYGKWNWVYGLGIAGQVSGAILWYDIDEKVRSFENEIDNQGPQPNVSQTLVRLNFDTHRVRPYIQAFIGLDWERCFIPKWLSAQLAIGYEVQYFWSVVVNPLGNDDIPTSFEGLTLKARIDF